MRKSRIGLTSAALVAVAGLTLAGCAAADEEVAATDAADTTEEAAATGETYEVYALLPGQRPGIRHHLPAPHGGNGC